MNTTTLDEAIRQAKQFVSRTEALKKAAEPFPTHGLSIHPKESGAVKRASMDLTRALAEMRRAG